MKRFAALPVLLLCAAGALAADTPVPGAREPLPFKVPAQMRDAIELLPPSGVHLDGYLGKRVQVNEQNRLVKVDDAPLLAGFRQKPGVQAWIGEHVGKWLHASTLAWANTGDPVLRAKLDHVVAELIKTQEPDGYLGTYTPQTRFQLARNADWDVWVHKYDLLGLLTYYQYTGNQPALDASRKVGDLLCNTFGPGKKSILSAGTHMGMAATSVLEPMVLLYRHTGEPRYLEFCKYIVQSWDEPNGPKVLNTLLTQKSVSRTANGKAYEMLSNLVGLCELARVTGEKKYLDGAVNAWEDVVAHQLYITGTASSHEHFHADYELPNQMGANVGETCVTVTWIQLNAQLMRLTGQARYGDELERSYYNHLAAAQRPDGAMWCYYTALEGTKPYGPGINCCVSSGPRGMAMAPQLAYVKTIGKNREGLAVNLFDSGHITTKLNGELVTIDSESKFPANGDVTLTVHAPKNARFPISVRWPAWTNSISVVVGGKNLLSRDDKKQDADQKEFKRGEWINVPARPWKDGEKVRITFNIPSRMIMGEHTNAGKAALAYGPLVLAYDQKLNPEVGSGVNMGLTQEKNKPPFTAAFVQNQPIAFQATVRTPGHLDGVAAFFIPFAEAGVEGSRYQIWLRAPGTDLASGSSLMLGAAESRSHEGNQPGSITDGDPNTFAVTFDAQPHTEDWFEATFDKPTTFRRIAFSHGRCFHDGGWFDASAGKPQVQVKRNKRAEWVTVGTLSDYPATTATDSKGLRDGQSFTLKLAAPVTALSVRVVGKPAHGDNPAQGFASCGELQAFAD